MKHIKYAVNEDYIFQLSDTVNGWVLVSKPELDATYELGYVISETDFNEDAFEIVTYPVDLLEAIAHNDVYEMRDGTMEIYQFAALQSDKLTSC